MACTLYRKCIYFLNLSAKKYTTINISYKLNEFII